MSSGSTLLLAVLAVIIMCVAVSAAAKRPGSTWNYYYFDGRGFVAGQPADNSPFLAVRDRVLPVVLTRAARIEAVALPSDKGALAGICYIQSSGGKLASGRGYAPCAGITVSIFSGDTLVLRTQTDENGYFIALLAAGVYRINNGTFAAEATLESRMTVLVPLLAGRRMID